MFKSKEAIKKESEFILLIKLNSPTIMGKGKVNKEYKILDELDTMRDRAAKERVNVLSKW